MAEDPTGLPIGQPRLGVPEVRPVNVNTGMIGMIFFYTRCKSRYLADTTDPMAMNVFPLYNKLFKVQALVAY